jgi:hypothetical protein
MVSDDPPSPQLVSFDFSASEISGHRSIAAAQYPALPRMKGFLNAVELLTLIDGAERHADQQ